MYIDNAKQGYLLDINRFMGIQSKQLFRSIRFPLLFIITIWLVKLLESTLYVDWVYWGIRPGDFGSIGGVFLSPFLHSRFSHLLSNTFSSFILLSALFYFYKKIAWRVITFSIVVLGMLVWIFARQS